MGVRHIAAADRIEFLKQGHSNVGPVAMEVQMALGGSRTVCER